MGVLAEHQRIKALEALDEDDSEGEESDDVCIFQWHANLFSFLVYFIFE